MYDGPSPGGPPVLHNEDHYQHPPRSYVGQHPDPPDVGHYYGDRHNLDDASQPQAYYAAQGDILRRKQDTTGIDKHINYRIMYMIAWKTILEVTWF